MGNNCSRDLTPGCQGRKTGISPELREVLHMLEAIEDNQSDLAKNSEK